MSLVIVGSVAFDTIETPHGRRDRIVGGSGTYCSLAASFFTKPKIVAVVGEDFPADVVAFLRSRSIDTEGLEVRAGAKTFHWAGRYEHDPNIRETLKTELNVFQDFHPVLPADCRNADIIYLANIDPDLEASILEQMTRPRLVALDTIQYWIETKTEALWKALGRVNVFFTNDQEAKLLTGEVNLIKAGRRILEAGPSYVVLKKGEHGALIMGRDLTFGVLAHPTEDVVDPTGAGDSFAGGFLGYLDASGRLTPGKIRRAAVYGSVIASFAIEDFGIDRFRTLTRADIRSRYKHFKRLVSF
jgi:sugar/nucleoside kinase (ribokinase family)